jgi:hypothetical protein
MVEHLCTLLNINNVINFFEFQESEAFEKTSFKYIYN